MADAPIAFIDSGIGGLPYLSYARRMLPNERYVHVADAENFPYGEKSPEEITSAVLSLTQRLLDTLSPKLVVVACNTMSVIALAALRARFPVPFVGVVPAVKPAASLTRKNRVGVLATRRTVEGEYLKDLIQKFAAGCQVVSIAAGELVDFVERDLFHAGPAQRRERVSIEAERLKAEGVDTVVLACTHYLHLEREFQAELDGMTIVDSREGVSRQIVRLLHGGPRNPPALGQGSLRQSRCATAGAGVEERHDSLYLTGGGPMEERYAYFAREFSLSLEGTI